jgi:hypothetical protein
LGKPSIHSPYAVLNCVHEEGTFAGGRDAQFEDETNARPAGVWHVDAVSPGVAVE